MYIVHVCFTWSFALCDPHHKLRAFSARHCGSTTNQSCQLTLNLIRTATLVALMTVLIILMVNESMMLFTMVLNAGIYDG